MNTVYELLQANCKRYPKKPALVYGNKRMTYEELDREINILASGFHSLGIGRGTKVAMLMKNSINFVTSFFSLMKLGAYISPINYRLQMHEISELLTVAGCEYLILGSEFDAVFSFRNETSISALKIICNSYDTEFPSLNTLLSADTYFETFEPVQPDDEVLNIFTSGTTGLSKAAVHTAQRLYMSIHTMVLSALPDLVYLSYAPLFHFGGMSVMLQTLCAGGTFILTENFNPECIPQIVDSEKVSSLILIPPSLSYRIKEHADKSGYSMASVKEVTVSGGACTEEIIDCIFSMMPNAHLINGYSQSECAVRLAVSLSREEYIKNPSLLLSVGKPTEHCQVKLVDDTGKELGNEECGELWGKSPFMMTHYLNCDSGLIDGWFPTGDLMKRDAEGYYYFLGRKKDMIKSGGENVYAHEVESVIMRTGKVRECLVFGLPDKELGEIVAAAIIKKPDSELSEDEIIKWCKNNIARYKKPRKVFFMDSFPMGTTGKECKALLRSMFADTKYKTQT